ncbi:aldehyde dehydrogenase family protein [Halobium salinum]|uniref:Aldehyde dehydrogenase family protein n=1 Tax=Halobium salinum TaxID=1364940 RepID=A0ABD5PAS5_9EURY|nr:aldehyde dehydrogenase family protein [Halobium salinum]
MPETFKNYIDGEWRDSETGDTFEVSNPADDADVVGEYQFSSAADANGAVEAAAAAQDEWADTDAGTRGTYLREVAKHLDDREEELTELLVREEGKTRTEANGEVNRAIDIFYYYAERAMDYNGEVLNPTGGNQNLYYVREPMGVAGLVTPWNYPIAIPAWKMAPALATGNTVAIKPAKRTPNSVRAIFEAFDEAGLPDGVVNMVTGSGSEVGNAIVEHEQVDCVSFTGSRQVGETIYEQATDDHKRIQTELGSKNPSLVMPSADVAAAAETVGAGAFGVTGQACTATERVLVHEEVYDEFVDHLVEYAEGLEVGPGLDDPGMGPHVSEDQLETTLDYVELGEEEGATLEYGGERLDGDEYDGGHFVSPTIFTDVESDMRIMQEEVFGPFVGVMPVSDLDEGIELANDVEYGLSAGILSQDHTEINRFIDEVDFGIIKPNAKTTGLDLHVPFGGMNASSSETYREQGEEGMDYFTIIKTVYDNY